MNIQLTIYFVKWLYNWLSTNDYTIDYIHTKMPVQFTMLHTSSWILYIYDDIHSQITIQYEIYTG